MSLIVILKKRIYLRNESLTNNDSNKQNSIPDCKVVAIFSSDRFEYCLRLMQKKRDRVPLSEILWSLNHLEPLEDDVCFVFIEEQPVFALLQVFPEAAQALAAAAPHG